MEFKELEKLQKENCFKLSPADRWDDINANPIDDLRAATKALSKCESFYMKSMRWLFGKHLQETKN